MIHVLPESESDEHEDSTTCHCRPSVIVEDEIVVIHNPLHFEEISLCPYCEAPTEEKFSGDEGWTFCSDGCGCLEGVDLIHKFICLKCQEICDKEECNCQ